MGTTTLILSECGPEVFVCQSIACAITFVTPAKVTLPITSQRITPNRRFAVSGRS
jgi:hypothetical protein